MEQNTLNWIRSLRDEEVAQAGAVSISELGFPDIQGTMQISAQALGHQIKLLIDQPSHLRFLSKLTDTSRFRDVGAFGTCYLRYLAVQYWLTVHQIFSR